MERGTMHMNARRGVLQKAAAGECGKLNPLQKQRVGFLVKYPGILDWDPVPNGCSLGSEPDQLFVGKRRAITPVQTPTPSDMLVLADVCNI